jgi:hypothetical protein
MLQTTDIQALMHDKTNILYEKISPFGNESVTSLKVNFMLFKSILQEKRH